MRWLCVLETMWGARAGRAPSLFAISSANFSGRRLYELTGEEDGCLWCTNCCRELVTNPNHHGTPDVAWLRANLIKWLEIMWRKQANFGVEHTPGLLVCGRIAQDTFGQIGTKPECRTIYLPHPAARMWTREGLATAGRIIREWTSSVRLEMRKDRIVAKTLKGS